MTMKYIKKGVSIGPTDSYIDLSDHSSCELAVKKATGILF